MLGTVKGTLFRSACCRALALAAFAGSASASAQEQSAATAAEDGEIVVTGSLIARRDFDSASPIVTLDRKLIERSSAVSVDTFVQSLPQLGSANSGATGNNTANGGISTVNLHNLGENRTLVLLDGRRVVPGDGFGAVDLNLFPVQLIQSVDQITGIHDDLRFQRYVRANLRKVAKMTKTNDGFANTLRYQS